MTDIKIKEEHQEELDFFVDQLNGYGEMFQKAQDRFAHAKAMSTKLYAGSQRAVKMNLGVDNDITCRNAEILAHFLNMAREADGKMALYQNILNALRESLSLFLAEQYNITTTSEWTVDLDTGLISFKE